MLYTEFGKIVLVKLVMVFTTVLLSVLHDLVLGTRVTRMVEAGALPSSPDSAGAPPGAPITLRRSLSLLTRLNLLLALAAILVRGLPQHLRACATMA
jgi:hypothetical protein